MEKYLRIPGKIPENWKNRKHSDFVTSLTDEKYVLPIKEIINAINDKFSQGIWTVINTKPITKL